MPAPTLADCPAPRQAKPYPGAKIDPDRLPDAVVCYVDSTVALPIITAYALARHAPRKPKRLYERREEFMAQLVSEYQKSKRR